MSRPMLHYTPKRGKMSFPHGLFRYGGGYRMLYVCEEDGYKSLKLIESEDLVSWTEVRLCPGIGAIGEPIAVLPTEEGILIYYIDRSCDRLLIASSRDGGESIDGAEMPPALDNLPKSVRHPFVYREGGRYILFLYEGREVYGIYTSSKPYDFEKVSSIALECQSEGPVYIPFGDDCLFIGADGRYVRGSVNGEGAFKPRARSGGLFSSVTNRGVAALPCGDGAIIVTMDRGAVGAEYEGQLSFPIFITPGEEGGIRTELCPEAKKIFSHREKQTVSLEADGEASVAYSNEQLTELTLPKIPCRLCLTPSGREIVFDTEAGEVSLINDRFTERVSAGEAVAVVTDGHTVEIILGDRGRILTVALPSAIARTKECARLLCNKKVTIDLIKRSIGRIYANNYLQ